MDSDTRTLVKALCEEMAELKTVVRALTPAAVTAREIYQSLLTREIKDDSLRVVWDNFDCKNNMLILGNAVSVERAGSVRVHAAFGLPVKLAYYLNSQGAYLNSSQYLSADCGYVFDIPINPGDALNFMVTFDDSEITTVRCKFFRLQEVR